MDFLNALTQEHSRTTTDRIAKAIGDDPLEFKKLIDIIYNGKAPIPQRASWVLAPVSEKYPELIEPYISKFISTVSDFKVDAIKRNFMRALTIMEIPKKLHSKVIHVCFQLLLSPEETVVVKVHSLQLLVNLCKLHPELKNELKAVINDQLPKNTAAFSARARRVMKELKC